MIADRRGVAFEVQLGQQCAEEEARTALRNAGPASPTADPFARPLAIASEPVHLAVAAVHEPIAEAGRVLTRATR